MARLQAWDFPLVSGYPREGVVNHSGFRSGRPSVASVCFVFDLSVGWLKWRAEFKYVGIPILDTTEPTFIVQKGLLTSIFRSCLLFLYHVIIAGGFDPVDIHLTPYLWSAINGESLLNSSMVSGRTINKHEKKKSNFSSVLIPIYFILQYFSLKF